MQIFRLHRSYFTIALITLALVCGLNFNLSKAYNETIVSQISTTHKVIALTFDDGPHYKATPEILRILKEKNVKATFFVLGANAKKNPQLVSQAANDGHEIASHGYSHKQIDHLFSQELQKEISETEKIITAVAPKPSFFRPPYGSYNNNSISILSQNGYTTILWSIDSYDWQRLSVDQVVKNVLNYVRPGRIILMHDGIYPLPTSEALPIIIDRLHAEGYEFVTMTNLLAS